MLLLESTIASMMNLNYCPRPTCNLKILFISIINFKGIYSTCLNVHLGQYPVSVENETTMGSCPACQFHFCLLCKATYHGVAPCKMNIGMNFKLFFFQDMD